MVIATVFGAVAVAQPASQLANAYAATEQAERLGSVQTNLAQADASAMTALLDPNRADALVDNYSRAMNEAYRAALSAAADHDDLEPLIDVVVGMRAYEDSIDEALRPRTSEADDPVVVEPAHATLWNDLIPQMAPVTVAPHRLSALVILALVLAGLSAVIWIVVMVVAARRTHRVFNLWFVGALLAVAALIVQVTVLGASTNHSINQHLARAETVRMAQDVLTNASRVQAADALAALYPARAGGFRDEATAALDAASAAAASSSFSALNRHMDTISTIHQGMAAGVTAAEALEALTGHPDQPWANIEIETTATITATVADRTRQPGDATTLAWTLVLSASGLIGLVLGLFGFRARLTEYP
jgi:hypothetical protein